MEEKPLSEGVKAFREEMLLKQAAARRLFESAHKNHPHTPETAVLLVRSQVLEEVLRLMERTIPK